MSDDLVEQVARRLAEVSVVETQKILCEFKGDGERMPARALLSVSRAVAAEVVRLMEWGCEQGILWCENEETYSWGRPTDPLTLPSPDWQPLKDEHENPSRID